MVKSAAATLEKRVFVVSDDHANRAALRVGFGPNTSVEYALPEDVISILQEGLDRERYSEVALFVVDMTAYDSRLEPKAIAEIVNNVENPYIVCIAGAGNAVEVRKDIKDCIVNPKTGALYKTFPDFIRVAIHPYWQALHYFLEEAVKYKSD